MRLFVGVFAIGVAAPASAQSCAGFTDVPASSGFCANVEWLKNRAITTGCASPPNPPNSYCPSDSVTRLQMAAFMNRLGTALTPVLHFAQDLDLTGTLGTGPAPAGSAGVVCSTANIAVTNFPRKVLINGAGSFAAEAGGRFGLYPVFSTDDGASWSLVGLNAWISHETSAGGQNFGLPATAALDLDVGTSYRFALYFRRLTGTAVNYIDGECSMTVAVFSRDGTASPFDERPAPRPPRE